MFHKSLAWRYLIFPFLSPMATCFPDAFVRDQVLEADKRLLAVVGAALVHD